MPGAWGRARGRPGLGTRGDGPLPAVPDRETWEGAQRGITTELFAGAGRGGRPYNLERRGVPGRVTSRGLPGVWA